MDRFVYAINDSIFQYHNDMQKAVSDSKITFLNPSYPL